MNLETFDNVLWDCFLPQMIERHRHSAKVSRMLGDEDTAQLQERLADWMSTASREQIRELLARTSEAERREQYEALKREFE